MAKYHLVGKVEIHIEGRIDKLFKCQGVNRNEATKEATHEVEAMLKDAANKVLAGKTGIAISTNFKVIREKE